MCFRTTTRLLLEVVHTEENKISASRMPEPSDSVSGPSTPDSPEGHVSGGATGGSHD